MNKQPATQEQRAPVLKRSEFVEVIKQSYFNSSSMSFLGDDKQKAQEIMAGFLYTVNKNPAILSCTQPSIMIALSQCSQFGLVPGAKQECALIPYGKDLTFQPMVAGVIKKAYDSGFVTHIDCEVIYKHDHFEYEQGTETKLVFKKNLFSERGEILGGYCVLTLKDGQKIIEVMPFLDIKKIENSAKNKSIWNAHWSEMARKTLIKRALKRVVKSAEIAELIDHDNKLERPDYSEENREKLEELNLNLAEVEDTAIVATTAEVVNQEAN